MTVGELIRHLEQLSPGAKVYAFDKIAGSYDEVEPQDIQVRAAGNAVILK